MSVRVMVARRAALAVLLVYLVFTLSFAFVALTPDPNIGSIRYGAALSCKGTSQERADCIDRKVAAYRDANNLNEPVHERYVDWLVAMSTLRWGTSAEAGGTVLSAISRSLPYTLLYVVPAMLLSAAGGLVAGAYFALHPDRNVDRAGIGITYLGYGLPNFWIAAFLLVMVGRVYPLPLPIPGTWIFHWDPQIQPGADPFELGTMLRMVFPTAVLSTTLFTSQLRHGRAELLEHAGSAMVKMVRAKGLGDRGVARHVYRLAAPLLLSLFVVDLFGVILVNIFVVEYVFDIPGFGALSLRAITARDMPLLLGTTMVVAIVGIAGSLLKDLATLALDPRIEDGER